MATNGQIGWFLVTIGLTIALIGLFWLIAPPWLRPGRLPGDLVIEGRNSRFHFPIVTCILLSLILSLVVGLLQRLFR